MQSKSADQLATMGKLEAKKNDAAPYIPYGRQSIDQADIDAVIAVLQSDMITQGPTVERFERALADYCWVQYGVAVNSATSALHIACLSLDVSEGDIVWTSPVSFVASANCALYCGARIDFVDIDPISYNMSITALEEKLKKAELSGELPKVVIPVHLSGLACDMRAIARLAEQYGFSVIEDASHAIGGRYLNEPVGSCQYSDITVFSFHPVKIITSAEGGMAMTNNPELAARLQRLRSHGITRDPALMTQEPDGPWYYQQIDLGFNYRMTDLQAGLGLSQLERIDSFIDARHEIAQRYDEQLADLPLHRPSRSSDSHSALHLYIVRLDVQKSFLNHRQVFETLREKNIGINLHYIPIHTQPYFAELGFKKGEFPEAERYYQQAFSLPIFPDMTDQQQSRICDALMEVLQP